MDAFVQQLEPAITLSNILHMTDAFCERRIKPILYNYIGEKRFFMRNAAIAMGNSKEKLYTEDLTLALDNPDGMIREYAAWALGEIGGPLAERTLRDRLGREPEEPVKRAILQALQNEG